MLQVGCKLSLVLFQYCIMANFCWLLVEGLYLHTLLVAIFAPSRCFLAYLLIGWGKTPWDPAPPADTTTQLLSPSGSLSSADGPLGSGPELAGRVFPAP